MSIPWGFIAAGLTVLTALAAGREILTIRNARAPRSTATDSENAAGSAARTGGIAAADSPQKSSLSAELKVLVIEHDRKSANDFRAKIAKQHPRWRVTQSTPTSLNLEQLRSGHFDVVVLDLNMPKMDGLQLLRQKIVNQVRGFASPVIYVSGFTPDSFGVKPQEVFVQSPLSSDDVITALESAAEPKLVE